MIKILQLISGELIIGQIIELPVEPKILVEESFIVSNTGNLEYYPRFSEKNSAIFDSSKIITIYDPNEMMVEEYIKNAGVLLAEDPDEFTGIMDTFFPEE
jgi:hypothetical protein